ncbi:RICIN domain-containing protein [Glycomyces sp. L485]|uniref:RICIN domain-containing protein n=1 Tax=Glycomyces sp. L485 TaxID=2909235 RepID=UPI001F4B2736|nr:RICIN domain-containing protein [Glycomyces sp. L485]MCH7229439.1 RICIN domain-containing protein [Glycomyces sp. L485]
MSERHDTERPRTPSKRASVGRRRLFQGAIGAAGLAVAGAGSVGIAGAQGQPAGVLQNSHPGMLHTEADLDRMAEKVDAGAEPWTSGWDKLVANGRSHSTWEPRPVEVVVRGGGQEENYAQLYLDIAAAYQNALRWKISGDTAHGDAARDICNAWSQTLRSIDPTHSDSRLASGIYGYQFANVGELIRDYDGFDLARFQDMMHNVFYPLNSDFLARHNDTCDSHYWANWDLCNMASIIAIGILRDDQAQFDEAVDYFHNGEGNGSIENAIPFVYDDGLAQWQESGRDQAHSIMGIGLMAAFMEMAWNQGLDLYSANDNAFAKAAEYVARYNLGYNDVPFTTYSWGFGHNCDYREHTAISEGGRGEQRPVWEMVYNHYSVRRGLKMPNVARMAASLRPEGGGGDYNSSSGGFDALGFGTLANTLPTPAVVSGGVYTLTCERSGKVLDNAASSENGQRMIQWGANGGTQQRWYINDVGGGYHRLLCQHSGKALDNGNTATEGARVIQWTDNRGPQQRWRITDVGGGAVKLTCERSGMVLDNGNGEADGDGVIQWSDNGGPQQRWHLHRIA